MGVGIDTQLKGDTIGKFGDDIGGLITERERIIREHPKNEKTKDHGPNSANGPHAGSTLEAIASGNGSGATNEGNGQGTTSQPAGSESSESSEVLISSYSVQNLKDQVDDFNLSASNLDADLANAAGQNTGEPKRCICRNGI